MSSDDRNKTVFRPSPLKRGGGDTNPAAPGQPPVQGGFSSTDDWGQPAPHGLPAGGAPVPMAGGFSPLGADPFAPAPGSMGGGFDGGGGGADGAVLAQQQFSDSVPQPPQPRRDRNIIMAHAAPVLAMAAALQSGRWQVSMGEFHRRATEAISAFDAAIQPAYPDGVKQRAKYALCATIDDIAQNLPGVGGGGAEWAQRNMVVIFFRENIAGDRFWDFVTEVLRDPARNRDLIELFHACLAAGFEGRTRAMPDGHSKKSQVMASLVAALDHVRSLSQSEIVSHWRGATAPRKPNNFWSIIGLAAAAAAGLCFLVYLVFFVTLMLAGEDAHDSVTKLFPDEPIALTRQAQVLELPPTGTEQRLRTFLADEIAQGLVVVQGNRVRTTVGTLFEPAAADLVGGRAAIFEKIGKAIELEKGPVTVEGHADSDKISPTIEFADNLALSKARAETVATIVRAQLSDPGRITVEGLGDTVPLASNATPEGKAQNRRVEFVVELGS
jgi:type VI secretion system protein ImpK